MLLELALLLGSGCVADYQYNKHRKDISEEQRQKNLHDFDILKESVSIGAKAVGTTAGEIVKGISDGFTKSTRR